MAPFLMLRQSMSIPASHYVRRTNHNSNLILAPVVVTINVHQHDQINPGKILVITHNRYRYRYIHQCDTCHDLSRFGVAQDLLSQTASRKPMLVIVTFNHHQ